MDVRDFSLDLFSLEGRVAVVTGGNTGLGQAFTTRTRRGPAPNVFVPSLADDDGDHARARRGAGPPLRVPRGRHHAARRAGARRRRLRRTSSARSTSSSTAPASARSARCSSSAATQWDPTVAVNLTAAFEMSYEAAKRMIPQRQREDRQHLLDLQLPRRPAVAGVRRDEARHRRADEGLLRRARRAQHPGQRHRAGLLRDRDHARRRAATRTEPARARAHPGRPLGRAGRPDGRASSSSRAAPPTTSTGTSSPSTAATSSARPRSRGRHDWPART